MGAMTKEDFNPRAPCGARPVGAGHRQRHLLEISIHAPRAGRDLLAIKTRVSVTDFNPRAPCGARLSCSRPLVRLLLFQSTRPVRGATGSIINVNGARHISIHAPRAGRDLGHHGFPGAGSGISIHAPRAGRDGGAQAGDIAVNISIHAPRAGRDNDRY